MTEYVLGIDIVGEGGSKIVLDPHLGDLTYAKGSVATPRGKVTVEHTKNANGVVVTRVDAPSGIEVVFA